MWEKHLRQVEFGSRRQTCRWNYTIPEQRDRVFTILLPDLQYFRRWIRLLAVKVRVEALDHRFEVAIPTLETGLAFARHVGEGPFLVNANVGANNAHILLNELETLISQPGAPNLYWALTTLPRPLIAFRDAAERELAFGRWMIPELNDLDQPRSPLEWSARLARLYARLVQFEADARNLERSGGINSLKTEPVAPLPDYAHFPTEVLPEERNSDAEAIVRYLAHLEEVYRDAETKAAALPFPEAGPFYDEADRQRVEAMRGPLRTLYAILQEPVVRRGFLNETLLDRRIAALRVIEALRIHADQVGHLPKTLAEIHTVPIPLGPLSGNPFEYQLDGETATLPAPPGLPARAIAKYRITLRR